jgi:antitoxin component of MazEF toxin-antitoxin module
MDGNMKPETRVYDPNDCVDYLYEYAPEYAKAKGELAELEAYKSSLKAIMMKKSNEQSLGAQEREAYATQEYQELCKAIGAATFKTEMWKYRLEAAKLRFEAWRTQEASNRTLERLTK